MKELSAVGDALRMISSDMGARALESRGGDQNASHADAGRQWLHSIFQADVGERLTISAGSRSAFLAVLSHVVAPGGVLLTEAMTWPAIKAVASLLRIRLVGVEMDREGITPEGLEHACRLHKATALYCTPTVQNPTGAIMTTERRKSIADIARNNDLVIVEDDAYGKLVPQSPPPIATLAPDIVIYVGGLAKTLISGLRVAYVVCPDSSITQQIAERLRLTMLLPPPLEAAVASRIILSGAGHAIVDSIRREMKIRHNILRSTLGEADIQTSPGALHAFLKLPAKWPRAQLIAFLANKGVRVASSDSFAIALGEAPNALRLSIGAPSTAGELKQALQTISNILAADAAFTDVVV